MNIDRLTKIRIYGISHMHCEVTKPVIGYLIHLVVKLLNSWGLES